MVQRFVVNVFVDDNGQYGNPAGIVLDEDAKISRQERQKMARESGFSEVVFVEKPVDGRISIYNPQREVSFAGHAGVGAAWFFKEVLKRRPKKLIIGEASFDVRMETSAIWVTAKLELAPPWQLRQLDSRAEVENFSEGQSLEHIVIWAWIDKSAGLARARTFAPDWGIPEDEANGSGSMLLASKFSQELIIIHGKGSIIHAKPVASGKAEVGGECALSDQN